MLDAKMKDKVTSVVLCAVLVFYAMVPVSDFQKPQKAEAIAPAIAATTVLGTALAAAGVYVAGTTAAGYDANLESISQGFQSATSQWSSAWSEYVSAQGSYDMAMQSCVTEQGNISLVTLQENGFFDSLSSYTVYCVDNGTMVTGADSTAANVQTLSIGDVNVPIIDGYPSGLSAISSEADNFVNAGLFFAYQTHESTPGYCYTIWMSPTTQYSFDGQNLSIWGGYSYINYRSRNSYTVNDSRSGSGINLANAVCIGSALVELLGDNATVVNDSVSDAVVDAGGVGVSQEVVDAGGVVQPYYPTAEQLAEGITSSQVVQAIETNTGEIADVTGDIATDVGSILTAVTTSIGGVLNDIKTGVNGLETAIGTAAAGAASTVVTGVGQAVGALGDVLGDISTTLDNVWQGAQGWWADVLAWLGATPLAQLIAQIIAAVNAGVMTLEGAISAVQSWISTGVAEIVGAIEGIGELIPSGAAEEEPAEPQPGTGVALPPNGLLPSFELDLRSKAPFAYIVAFFETFQDAANTFSNNPSFYLDLKIPSVDENGLDPDGDELRFDAGEWLNYDVNGVTIAFIIRVLVTASICAGLIYVMYNAYLYAFRQ